MAHIIKTIQPGILEELTSVKLLYGNITEIEFEIPAYEEGELSKMNVSAHLLMIDADVVLDSL